MAGCRLGLRKHMLDASNLARTYVHIAQARIWVKVAREEMETTWSMRRMESTATDATAKIAERDTLA